MMPESPIEHTYEGHTDGATRWDDLKALFEATFEATPADRARILESVGHTEPDLLPQLEALLAAHDSAMGLLDQPAIAAFDGIDPDALRFPNTLIGRRLGPYRVVREIARGGMGAVYEGARQDGQFEQRVAIKTISIGTASDTIRRRFERERRILAGLQHSHIAPLYDGGITDDGIPYFVLEYVDGDPIDAHCAAHHLDLVARLRLFLQVVDAVQHAHRQLVVHRDLKPGNILVTRDGVVKLVDFGIARLLEPDGRDITAEALAPLTLGYASPEQVRGEPVTTATDVYALGAVLYRLLAGTRPLEVDDVSLERAIATISQKLPELPSRAAQPRMAAEMRVDSPERISRMLRGDLDSIVMMALRKEPERRYATAQALRDDLQRYLDGLPVSAVADSAGYRLGKFIRRRRALVSGVAIGAAALTIGSGLALWQARSARVEASRARDVSRFLQGVIGAGDLSAFSTGARLGPTATIAALLDSAARRVSRELQHDPVGRSGVHIALGRAYSTQERWSDARAQFDSALLVIRRSHDRPRIEAARALTGMAEAELRSGGGRATELSLQARAAYDSLDVRNTAEYSHALHILGVSLALGGQWAAGETVLQDALRILNRISRGPAVQKAITLADLVAVQEAQGGALARADSGYKAALAMLDSLPRSDIVERGEILWYAARNEFFRGNTRIADSLSREALRVFERAIGPGSQRATQQLALLAGFARSRGDTATARRYIEEALATISARPDMPPIFRERVQLEHALQLRGAGRIQEAEAVAQIAYQSRQARGNSPYIVEAAFAYALILREGRRFAEAERVLLDGHERSLSLFGESGGFTHEFAAALARLYHEWGRVRLAESYLARLPEARQQALREELRRSGGSVTPRQ